MNPYIELKKIMSARKRVTTAEVIEVSGRTLRVRTRSGVIDARAVDATIYVVGDEVLLRDTIVQGKVKSLSTVPKYNV